MVHISNNSQQHRLMKAHSFGLVREFRYQLLMVAEPHLIGSATRILEKRAFQYNRSGSRRVLFFLKSDSRVTFEMFDRMYVNSDTTTGQPHSYLRTDNEWSAHFPVNIQHTLLLVYTIYLYPEPII